MHKSSSSLLLFELPRNVTKQFLEMIFVGSLRSLLMVGRGVE